MRIVLLWLMCVSLSRSAQAVTWYPHGPNGGDARAFAQDPRDHTHLYLGGTNGWLYQSHDNGNTWSRVARVGQRDDLVVDHILVDPADNRHLVVGAWVLSHTDGGIFVSHDSGNTWTVVSQMAGQSIRSMAASPSNWRTMLAGSLEGIYRSSDGGDHWSRISPAEPPLSNEIHNVESLAIDPKNPNVIYGGTWHLPWKSTDGGKSWESMKRGIIDDSDVFSIIVDPKTPSTVYVSACSGIYKSENTGASFVKMQGIPSDARRTRKLAQDPEHLDTVFAGTTLGLYRTTDAGGEWHLMTDPSMIINDVYIDPTNSNRVLLATDRGGVMASDDGGQNFRASNEGFSARQIVAYAADPSHPATLYVGVVNDKDMGGVFLSFDGGLSWTQDSLGLNGADVRSLAVAPDGTLLAGTQHGVFRLDSGVWSDSSQLANVPAGKSAGPKRTASTKRRRAVRVPERNGRRGEGTVTGTVYALASTTNSVYAATAGALLKSGDSGRSWKRLAVPAGQWDHVSTAGSYVLAAELKRLVFSGDDGMSWKTVSIPSELTQVSAAAVDGTGSLWVGGREGVFYSADMGSSWHTIQEMGSKLVNDIHDIYYDAGNGRLLVTGNRASTYGYAIRLSDKKVTPLDAGWNLRMLRPVGDHLVAATLYDGLVVQPRMVDSPLAPSSPIAAR